MANREIESNQKIQQGLVPTAVSANGTSNGDWIDREGFDAVMWDYFTAAYTDGTHTPLIEEADEADKSDAAAASDDVLSKAEASAALSAANTQSKISYLGNKRYVRLSSVATGVTTGATVGARSILGNPAYAPVA